MIYLASPYSHPDKTVEEKRFRDVCILAGMLMEAGNVVFSPIAHGHPISLHYKLPTDWKYWKMFATEYIKRSDKIMVAMMPGWKESVGVTAEIAIAEELGIPVFYMEV